MSMNPDAPPGPLRRAPELPRKLSMDLPADRAWMHRWQEEGLVIKAKVNGMVQSRLVAYDVDKGWLERVRCDDMGQPIVEGGRLQTDILQGRVEVEWRIDP